MLPKQVSSRRLRCYRAGRTCGEVRARFDAEPFADASRDGGGWGGWRAGAQRGQSVDALELLLDRAGQRERIEAVPQALQLGGHGRAKLRASEHAVERRPGHIVAGPDAGARALLAEEMACLRCERVTWQNSSRMRPFSGRAAC